MSPAGERENGREAEQRPESRAHQHAASGDAFGESTEQASRPLELSNLQPPAEPRPQPLDGQGDSNLRDTHRPAGLGHNEAAATTSKSPSGTGAKASFAASQSSGIGPATDHPTTSPTTPSSKPYLIITLLIHSTETRHPYTINESYLARRNVDAPQNNPVNISVYTLKELIWRDWREGLDLSSQNGAFYAC